MSNGSKLLGVTTLLCLAVTRLTHAEGAVPARDGLPGIRIDEASDTRRPSASVLASARVNPVCIRNGLETFSMLIGVVNPTAVVSVRIHTGLFRQNGAAVNPIVLYDNGANGDASAGDGIFTAAGLAFSSAPQLIGGGVLRFTTVDLVQSDSSIQSYNEDLALTVLYVQPSVPLPTVTTLAADVAASPHVVSIKMALQGTFPHLSVSSPYVTERYYALFPDDRDFLFVARMFNTGDAPAGSYEWARNDVSGIGLSYFDNSFGYGSAGVLQGVVNLYFGNSSSFTLNHELLHRWAAYLDPTLDLCAIPGSSNPYHWGAIEQESTGFGGPDPYAGAFDHLAPVTTTEYRGWLDGNVTDARYGPLELYLMGLATYDELLAAIPALVHPVWDRYVNDGGIRYSHYFADGMRGVSKAEIVSVAGLRLPAPGSAQTAFRSGIIVVYDRLLTPTEMAYWEYALAEYEKSSSTFQAVTFRQATRNRAGISTYIPLVAGAVPDGRWVPGTPLRVNRTADPEYVTLTWGPSCRPADGDYVVYQGPMGSFGAHAPVTCSTNGSTAWTFHAGPSSSYFLVAPRSARSEGSLGYNSSGAERSSASACLQREIGVCVSP